MVKQYNIIPHGNITNNNGVLSGFTTNTYASLNKIFNPVNNSYEVVFKVNSNNISDEQIIFQCGDIMSSSGYIDLEIYNSKLYFELCQNGGQTFYFEGSTTLVSQTDYWAKLTFDGTYRYELSLSTDGVNYSIENSVINFNILGDNINNQPYIGIDRELTRWYFNGTIDLNESYIKINDNIWWQGVSDVTRIQLRHDTANNWSAINPILLEGEVGLELDTGKQKVGDGVTAWNNLDYNYYTETETDDLLADKQNILVSGTNIKTVNNISLLGSGNIDTSEIFIAEYGVTSFADIETAYNAGKSVFCKDGNQFFMLNICLSPIADFSCIYTGTNATVTFRRCELNNGNTVWSKPTTLQLQNRLTYTPENQSNKVTSISSSSTDTQYPSAKCVYDKLADVVRQEVSTGGQSTTLYCYSYNDTNIYTFKIPSESFESITCYNKNCEYIGSGSSNSSNNGILLTIDGVTRTYSRNSTGDHTIMLSTLTDNSSNFLNITQADGQWVSSYIEITSANISTTLQTYSLSDYLPVDNYDYEVIFAAWVYKNGDSYWRIGTDLFPIGNEDFMVANSSYGRQASVQIILPVGIGRTVSWKATSAGAGCRLRAYGYRRIGTNL